MSNIFKAYKIRIYPNEEQYTTITKNMGCSRFVYNYFLNLKETNYKETKTNLSLKIMKQRLVELKQKEEYNFLKESDSMSLTKALENLDRAYTNFFNGRSAKPVFKRKGIHDSYTTNCIKGIYKNNKYSNIELDIVNRTIKLPKLGIVKYRGYRKLKEFKGTILNVTISKDANKIYASINVMEEIEDKKYDYNEWNSIAIDVGVKSLVVTSTGEEYEKVNIKRIEQHIKDLQKKLSKKVKGSKNYLKLKLKISRLYQKTRNKRKYYIHKITDKLIKENNVIITENLRVKEMITNEDTKKSLRRGLTNACLFELERQLIYKTKWRNKKLIKIDTYYPSSQICSSCGYQNKETKDLSVRSWTCPSCHLEHDRDINASLNILFQGLLKLKGLKEIRI